MGRKLFSEWETERVYVCCHENSLKLEPEEGKVSNMIATTDIKGALEWLNESLRKAKASHYQFVGKEDAGQLYGALEAGENCESTVYKDGDKNHREYYRICVSSFA